jgi:hypothetical protein
LSKNTQEYALLSVLTTFSYASDGPRFKKSGKWQEFREVLLNLTIERETTGLGFGENLLTVSDHIELPASAGMNLHIDVEAVFEQGRQTGSLRPVTSNSAIENFNSHE